MNEYLLTAFDMNLDLTGVFQDSKRLINLWRSRYSVTEYPKKVVMNIFYRKYSRDKMGDTIFSKKYPNWEEAYADLMLRYSETALSVNPILDSKLQSNEKVNTLKFSDFTTYIKAAASGDEKALKSLEYT